jgi:hypothetical protein
VKNLRSFYRQSEQREMELNEGLSSRYKDLPLVERPALAA